MSSVSFRGSVRPSLGVELELQLLDARRLALAAACDAILASLPPKDKQAVKPEFHASCVEINTDVCDDVAHVGHDLRARLCVLAHAASRNGVRLGWAGSHPFSHWRTQPIFPLPRYCRLDDWYRETLRRQLTFGLHVHVGVGDGDTAVRVCNRMVEHLPLLLALSANSPFWCGQATSLHSYRAEVMGSLPTSGLPPRLESWTHYVGLVDHLVSVGSIESAKDLWWDLRPSPENGTIEVRICDMPADLPSVLALTALIQCLVVDLARNSDADLDDCRRMIVHQNRWRAARFGLGAQFIDLARGAHCDGSRGRPRPDVPAPRRGRLAGVRRRTPSGRGDVPSPQRRSAPACRVPADQRPDGRRPAYRQPGGHGGSLCRPAGRPASRAVPAWGRAAAFSLK